MKIPMTKPPNNKKMKLLVLTLQKSSILQNQKFNVDTFNYGHLQGFLLETT